MALRKNGAGKDEIPLAAVLVAQRGALLRLIRYLGKGSLLEEDICHEVFLRAMKAENQPATETEKVAWLFRIARNLVIDEFRKKGRWDKKVVPLEATGSDESAMERVAVLPSARHRTSEREMEAVLAEALGDLDEKSVEMIALRFFAGLSTTEVAESLRVPVGTVCARIFRATKKMRNDLEEKGYSFEELCYEE